MKVFYDIINNFFLEECINCNEPSKIICKKCYKFLIRNNNKKIFKNDLSFINFSLNYKNELVKKALFRLKYNFTKNISVYLSNATFYDLLLFIKKITNEDLENIILSPIPISRKRFIERSYNQSEILLKDLIKKIIKEKNIVYKLFNKEFDFETSYLEIIKREKNTKKFINSHSREERLELIENAFIINKDINIEKLKNKKIILFDDITTTGATFYEAKKTLIKAGIEKDNIFTFALAH